MKAIVIARVSTEEQKEAGNSLPAQTARLEKYSQSRGFEVIKRFSFDESAYKDQRNEFDAILDYVIEQKEKVAVCFDKVDRLSRNVFDKRVSSLYEKALRDEIELHFVSDGQIINSQISAVEKFQFGISLGLAKYYSDAISDNVKRATEQKLRKGEWPGRAPYGYKNVTGDNDKKEIIVDEYPARVVQKVFEWYATSAYSMDLIREKLQKELGLKWSKGFLDNVLKNPFCYGTMLWKGKKYPHKYLPIISQGLFEQVQQIKTGFNKKRFKYAGLPYIYRGLIRCDHCGLSVTPEKHKGHIYYHCTQYNGKHNAGWIREEEVTEQLGSLYKRLEIPDDTYNDIVESLKGTHESKIEFREQQSNKLNEEREVYEKRRENLLLEKLDGRITADEYDKFYTQFQDKLAELDARLSMLHEAEDNYYITVKYLLELTKRAYELFVSSEVEQKRQLVKLTLQNLRLEGKNLRYDAVKPFDTILNFSDRQAWLRGVDSNHQPFA